MGPLAATGDLGEGACGRRWLCRIGVGWGTRGWRRPAGSGNRDLWFVRLTSGKGTCSGPKMSCAPRAIPVAYGLCPSARPGGGPHSPLPSITMPVICTKLSQRCLLQRLAEPRVANLFHSAPFDPPSSGHTTLCVGGWEVPREGWLNQIRSFLV